MSLSINYNLTIRVRSPAYFEGGRSRASFENELATRNWLLAVSNSTLTVNNVIGIWLYFGYKLAKPNTGAG